MEGISKRFGATAALSQVDLTVLPGEVHALIGENGAGKSTLMKVLSGAIAADAGTMELDGESYAPTGPVEARAHGVAMVYQELSLAKHLSVAENILLGGLPRNFGFVREGERDRLARKTLDDLGCTIPLQAKVGDLPIAKQQLVEIARALSSSDLRVLVMDEPTSSLSRHDGELLFAAIRRLRDSGKSVIYISHFLEECQKIADRYTVLRDGASVAGGEMATATIPTLITAMVGREVTEAYPRVPHAIGEARLTVSGLRGTKFPRTASLAVRRGEILGLFGLIGAGRTETLRGIFGLDRIETGEILIDRSPSGQSPPESLASGLGMVSENRKDEGLFLGRSLADNLTATKLTAYKQFGLVNASRQQDAAAGWIEKLGIKARSPSQAVGDMSGGNQQKVAIGRLLHHGADILLLDEPTRGIDIAAKAAIYRLIGELAAGGAAILMVSSYIPELLGVCDSIAVMCRGELGAAKPAAEWTEQTLIAAAIGQEVA